jgi:hypothetical protein
MLCFAYNGALGNRGVFRGVRVNVPISETEQLYNHRGYPYIPPDRRLQAVSDRPPAIGFSISVQYSSVRGCPTELNGISASGLVCSAAGLRIFMAAFKSWFTESLRSCPLVELTNAGSPRTRALCDTTSRHRPVRYTFFLAKVPLSLVSFVVCSSSLDGRLEENFSLWFCRTRG